MTDLNNFRTLRKKLEEVAQGKVDFGEDNASLYEVQSWFPYFDPLGDHPVNQVVRIREDGKQLFKCIQPYNGAYTPQVTLDDQAHWMAIHGTDIEHAYPFVQPTMREDMYLAGEYTTVETGIYKAKVDTAYSPMVRPEDWEFIK